jgi:CBS domain-containing protein
MYGFLKDILADKGTTVYTVRPGAAVREAVRTMNAHGVGTLVVVERGSVAGIFSERDVLRRIVDAGRSPETTTVADVMTREVIAVGLEMTVTDAMALMTRERVRHLPVLDGGGELAGLVSIGDLTRRVSMGQAHEIDGLANYITGGIPAGAFAVDAR